MADKIIPYLTGYRMLLINPFASHFGQTGLFFVISKQKIIKWLSVFSSMILQY